MSRKTLGLLALGIFALLLRLAAVASLPGPVDRPQTYEHGEIARNLVEGRGFTVTFLGIEGPTSQQAPWVPWLLAGAYSVCGVDSVWAVTLVQVAQGFAGAALALAVAWLTWSLVPDRPWAGWIAGYGAALYPPHIYMATHIQAAPWGALALTALLAVVVRARGGKHAASAAVSAGLLAGWLLLIEPILSLALPIVALVFVLRVGRQAPASVVAMPLVALLVVGPWLIRNYRVHGELVFIKSTFGYALWQGNHPISWGTDKIPKPSVESIRTAHDGSWSARNQALWQARHETLYIDDVLLKPDGYSRFAGLTEPERSRLLGSEVRGFILADPGRYLRLCLQRLGYFLWRDPTNPKTADPIYRYSTGAWLALSLLGLVCGRGYWRRWWPTAAIFAVVTLFHALTIVSARFRIPLEPLTFVWAATAVELSARRWNIGRRVAFWQRLTAGVSSVPASSTAAS